MDSYGNWLIEATIDDMQGKMAEGEVTSRKLVQMYLHRIAAHDGKIHSILEINPDALHIAAALDEEREKLKGRGGRFTAFPSF